MSVLPSFLNSAWIALVSSKKMLFCPFSSMTEPTQVNCRRPFPWKNIEKNLLDFYRTIGNIRKNESVFRNGLFRILSLTDERIVYIREPFDDDSTPILVAAVRKGALDLTLPEGACVLCGSDAADGVLHLGEGDVCYCRLDKSATAESLGI